MNSEIKLFSFQEKTNSEKEIQESKESVTKIAKKYNINLKTIQSTKEILFKSRCYFFSFTEKASSFSKSKKKLENTLAIFINNYNLKFI
jgi:hypothetical protein